MQCACVTAIQSAPGIQHRATFLLQSLLHHHAPHIECLQAPPAAHLDQLSVFQTHESDHHVAYTLDP